MRAFGANGEHSVSAVIETSGLGKRYRRTWALTDCTLSIPAGRVVGPGRPQRRREDHPAAPGRRAAGADRRDDRGARRHAGGRAARSWPGSGSSPRTRRSTPALSIADHLRLGAHLNPGWDAELARGRIGRLGLDPGQKAGTPVRRPARPARPDPGHRQAARAADPGRAGGQPRPAGAAGVPAGPDGGRRRARRERRAVLAPGRRPGTGLRLPGRAGRLPGAGRRAGRRAAGRAPPAAGPGGTRHAAGGVQVISASHTDLQTTCCCAPTAGSSTPPGPCRGRPGGPGPGLHEPGRRTPPPRTATATATWRYRNDLADLAPVPRPGAVAATALIAVAVILGVTGPHLAHLYAASGLASCQAATARRGRHLPQPGESRRPSTRRCTRVGRVSSCTSRPRSSASSGARRWSPASSRPGTFRLAWNQSVTRTRWLAVKLGLIGLAAMATAGLLSLMVTWWAARSTRPSASAATLGPAEPVHRWCSTRAASPRSATPPSPSPSASPSACSSAAPCRPWPSPWPSSPSSRSPCRCGSARTSSRRTR